MASSEEQSKKDARKDQLKAEALKLGVPYKELKAQKKAAKEMKKRSREPESLENPEHNKDMNRMRSWSGDKNDPTVRKGEGHQR